MVDIIFNKMRQGVRVRITKNFREYWGKCKGTWFDIMSYNADDTVTLQDKNHQTFANVPIKEVIV